MGPLRESDMQKDMLVYPLHSGDDTPFLRKFIMLVGFRFEGVLDHNKLFAALHTLFTCTKEWQRLAGRLYLNAKEKLEIRVPSVIDASYKTFKSSQTVKDQLIRQDPLASKLPSSSSSAQDEVSYVSHCESFQSLFHGPKQPQYIADYIAPQADEPIFAVHITSFADTTLLGITFPHAVLDIGGLGILMRNWQAIVNGNPLETDRNLPDPLVDQPLELVLSADVRASPIVKYMRAIPKPAILALGNGRKETAPSSSETPKEAIDITTPIRMAYVPASVIKEWHASIAAEVPGEEWISQGDVLASWWLKHRYSSSGKALLACFIADIRGRHPCMSSNYMGNALGSLVSELSPTDSQVDWARQIRKNILEQSMGDALARAGKSLKDHYEKTGEEVYYGLEGSQDYWITNWSKAGLGNVDFGGALAGCEEGRSCKPSFLYRGAWYQGKMYENLLTVVGKDERGGFWMHWPDVGQWG